MFRACAVCLAFAVACARPLTEITPARDVGPVAAAAPIWAAVIESAFPGSARVVMVATTIDLSRAPRDASSWVARRLPSDSAAMLSMLERNRSATSFAPSAYSDPHVVVLDEAGLRRVPPSRTGAPDEYFMNLARVYPGVQGVLRIAFPGVSEDGRTAFAYIQFACGGLCGWEDGFTLEREEYGWVVVARRRYSVI